MADERDRDVEAQAEDAIQDGKRMETRLAERGRGVEAFLLYMRTRAVECLLDAYRHARRQLFRAAVRLRKRARRIRKAMADGDRGDEV